jgi:hypothetical protein
MGLARVLKLQKGFILPKKSRDPSRGVQFLGFVKKKIDDGGPSRGSS